MEEELFDIEDFKDIRENLEEIVSKLLSKDEIKDGLIMLHSELLKLFNVLITYVDFSLQEKLINYAKSIFETSDTLLETNLDILEEEQKSSVVEAYEQLAENIISFIDVIFINFDLSKIKNYEEILEEDRKRVQFALEF
jgi:hypothetical protein